MKILHEVFYSARAASGQTAMQWPQDLQEVNFLSKPALRRCSLRGITHHLTHQTPSQGLLGMGSGNPTLGLFIFSTAHYKYSHGNPWKSERLLGLGSDRRGEARGSQSCLAGAARPSVHWERHHPAPSHTGRTKIQGTSNCLRE